MVFTIVSLTYRHYYVVHYNWQRLVIHQIRDPTRRILVLQHLPIPIIKQAIINDFILLLKECKKWKKCFSNIHFNCNTKHFIILSDYLKLHCDVCYVAYLTIRTQKHRSTVHCSQERLSKAFLWHHSRVRIKLWTDKQ